ncbi:hypothetical protein CBR_g52276 [Chara braunii]|uniref:Uncharacterized protein n=1 Tax=Chara braunii TaxID=69332 RepID=A0A388MAA2_CHABU|nr:hypothetical protein CBR_g52276 [Chara braunii]|eukprot:GBG91389.1 hypothetical protein CBR_g52276 [Chara braunii]
MGVSTAQSPPGVARNRGTRPSMPASSAGRPRERGEATTRVVAASLLGRTYVSWSHTRKSTATTRKKQAELGRRRSSMSWTREVHAAGCERRGGLDAPVEGAGGGGFAAPGSRVSTHGLRKVSQIIRADVVGPPRTQRPIHLQASRRNGETTGGEELEMMSGSRRTDTLISASEREIRRDGIMVVDNDHTYLIAEEADGEEDLPIHAPLRSILARGKRRTTTPPRRDGRY